MPDIAFIPAVEELGYFYDTVHGRVALEELPEKFHPALKSALSSKAIARLKNISQLGHTSVSFVSATHTRFSHAIGSMLVMNKLYGHVHEHGLSPDVFKEVAELFPNSIDSFGDVHNMVHCHLLLAALYQDVGELPFQKVTSLFFTPLGTDLKTLCDEFPNATPKSWSGKKVFSVLSLMKDFRNSELKGGFNNYDLGFLAYLITGDGVDGSPAQAQSIGSLLQLVDGVIDADRLDYVYRDASVTIGSLSRPSTVLESVIGYEPGRVIVNDPRPVTDFLSTRMRLWTFVYSSADVRFRQVLLKSVLDGRWETPETAKAFNECNLEPELRHDEFLKLDDNSLVKRIEVLDDSRLEPYRQQAKALLISGTLDYECRILRRRKPPEGANTSAPDQLPRDLFFDLLWDHGHHQMYRQKSVFVHQSLTSRMAESVPLEHSAGAFSPLFGRNNSAMLVPDGFYLFMPRKRTGGRWPDMENSIRTDSVFPLVVWEDARRGLACPTDTRNLTGFSGTAISISFCSEDFPTVVRIARELHRRNRRYWLFLKPFDGTGSTSAQNSIDLVTNAKSVLAVVSTNYLARALNGNSHISMEVSAMHDRANEIPIVVIGVDERNKLNAVKNWNWGAMNEDWRGKKPVIPNSPPLRNASQEVINAALDEVLKAIDQQSRHV